MILSTSLVSFAGQNVLELERDIPFYGSKIVTIRTGVDYNKCVCVKSNSEKDRANVHIFTNFDSSIPQKWRMQYEGYGWYSFVNLVSNKALDVEGGIGEDGNNVIQYTYHGGDSQLFALYHAPKTGHYYVKSKVGNYFLDVSGCSSANNTNVQIYSLGWSTPAQMFYFDELSNDSYIYKMDKFINDDRFKNEITWASSRTPKISSYSSKGCCAYAADFIKSTTGSNNLRSGKKFTSVSSIKDGSVLHLSPNHWIVVLERTGNSLYTAEGNASGKVCISTSKYSINESKIVTKYSTYTLSEGYNYNY